jgi:hypothetical protein
LDCTVWLVGERAMPLLVAEVTLVKTAEVPVMPAELMVPQTLPPSSMVVRPVPMSVTSVAVKQDGEVQLLVGLLGVESP